MKRMLTAAAALWLALLLTGCSTWVNLMSTLGFDSHDYADEEIVAWYEADSEEAARLVAVVRKMLLASPLMEPFSGASEAYRLYEDALLNAMLAESYSRYAGNPALLQAAEEAYPGRELLVLIPGADLESQFYTMFGGSWKVVHESSSLFVYLDHVNAYTAMTEPQFHGIETEFVSLIETENTYRLVFRNTNGEITSPDYEALLIKREDGTSYIRSLTVKTVVE